MKPYCLYHSLPNKLHHARHISTKSLSFELWRRVVWCKGTNFEDSWRQKVTPKQRHTSTRLHDVKYMSKEDS